MRRRGGVAPKCPCRLRSIVRTALPQGKCSQVLGRECSDPSEPVPASDTSDSLSDCDTVIGPSEHEPQSRKSNRHLELRAWEVIQKEIDDFNESYALRTLPHFHFFGSSGSYGSYSLSLTKTNQIPPGASEVPDPLLRMLAIQLLSTCFTLNHLAPTLHSDPRNDLNLRVKSPTHVSALRVLSRHRCSPAFGHNARENSVVSPWPALRFEPSRETKLAEEVTKRRILRNQQEADTLSSQSGHSRMAGLTRASLSTEELPSQPETQHMRLHSIDEMPLRKAPFCRSRLDHLFGPQVGNPVASRTTRLSSSDDGQSMTSLYPFLRSEPHPIFIQPVKELVVQRSKLRRIRSRARKIVIRQRPNEPRPAAEARCSGHRRRQLAMDSASAAAAGGGGGETEAPSTSALVSPVSGSTISLLKSPTLTSHPFKDFSFPVVSDNNQSLEQPPDTTSAPYLEPTSEANISVPVFSRAVRFEESRPNPLSNPEANSSMVNLPPLPSPTATPQDMASYQLDATPMTRRVRTSTAGTTVFTPHAIAETRANTEGILSARPEETTSSDDDWSTAPVSPVERHVQLERPAYRGGRSSFL